MKDNDFYDEGPHGFVNSGNGDEWETEYFDTEKIGTEQFDTDFGHEYLPNVEEVNSFVNKLEPERRKISKKVEAYTFKKVNGTQREPALTQEQIEKISQSLPEGFWRQGLLDSSVSKEQDLDERKRLRNSVFYKTADQQKKIAVETLKAQNAVDTVALKEDEITDLNSDIRILEEDLNINKDDLFNTKKQLKWSIAGVVALAVISIIMVSWVFMLKGSQVNVDADNLSDNPEVAQLQQQILQANQDRSNLEDKISDLQKQVDEAKKNEEESKKLLEKSSGDQGAALRSSQETVQRLNGDISSLKNQIDAKDNDIKAKQDRINNLERSLDDARRTQPQQQQPQPQPAQPSTVTVTVTPPVPQQ